MGTRGRAKRGRSAECLKSADYCRASFYSLFCVVRNFFSLSCTIFSYPHPADDDDGERRKSKKSDLRSLCVDIISNGNYVIHLNPSFVLVAEFALLVRFQIQQENAKILRVEHLEDVKVKMSRIGEMKIFYVIHGIPWDAQVSQIYVVGVRCGDSK